MKKYTASKLPAITIAFAIIGGGAVVYAADLPIPEQIKAAQAAGSVTNFSTISKEVEALWPEKPLEYFQYQNALGEALQPLCATNGSAKLLLEQQIELALSKKYPEDVLIIKSCISVKVAIVERVATVTTSLPTLHLAQLIAKTLGETRALIITNYLWQPVFANIMPPVLPTKPVGKWVISDGMDPNLIEDPVARVAYLKAITENNSRNMQNDLQEELPRINRAMTRIFLDYAKKALASRPDANKQADDLAASARLTTDERQQLK